MRGIELRGLKFSSFELVEKEGYYFNYEHAKQQTVTNGRFLVPFSLNIPSICIGPKVCAYLQGIKDSNIETTHESPLLFNGLKSGAYTKQPIGKNVLANIGKEIAELLHLPNPGSFTGHCFRRTAARAAADNGATTSDLKRHFGWKQESTANRYIDESESRVKLMARMVTGAKNPREVQQEVTAPMQENVGPINEHNKDSSVPLVVYKGVTETYQKSNISVVQHHNTGNNESSASKIINISVQPRGSVNIY